MTRRHTTLRNALTRLKALTQRYAEHCRYIKNAGPHPGYRLRQMDRSAGRLRGAIRRDLSIVQRLTAADDALAPLAGRLNVLTAVIIDHCDYFPRDQEWPGLANVIQQHETIYDMRAVIRGRAA